MSQFLRPVRASDLTAVTKNMRHADRQECRAAAGMSPELALFLSVETSSEAYTLVSPDGEPVGVCGLSPGNTERDRLVWMLATDGLLQHSRLFLRESRVWVDSHARRYVLWNYVDARNTVHIRWLKWLGATFHGAKTSPYTGTPLLHFTKVNKCA